MCIRNIFLESIEVDTCGEKYYIKTGMLKEIFFFTMDSLGYFSRDYIEDIRFMNIFTIL